MASTGEKADFLRRQLGEWGGITWESRRFFGGGGEGVEFQNMHPIYLGGFGKSKHTWGDPSVLFGRGGEERWKDSPRGVDANPRSTGGPARGQGAVGAGAGNRVGPDQAQASFEIPPRMQLLDFIQGTEKKVNL